MELHIFKLSHIGFLSIFFTFCWELKEKVVYGKELGDTEPNFKSKLFCKVNATASGPYMCVQLVSLARALGVMWHD